MEENDSQVGVSLGTKVGPVYWAQTSERKKSTVFLWKGKHNTAIQFSSVQFSRSVVSDSSQPHGLQHTRPPCLSPAPRVYSNLCPLSQWCHPTISSFVVPFSSCFRSFLASEELNEHTSYGERGNFHRSSSSPTSFLLMLFKIYHWPIS